MKYYIKKYFTKKIIWRFFGFHVQDFIISEIFYKIQNLNKWILKAVVSFLPRNLKKVLRFFVKLSGNCLEFLKKCQGNMESFLWLHDNILAFGQNLFFFHKKNPHCWQQRIHKSECDRWQQPPPRGKNISKYISPFFYFKYFSYMEIIQ